MLIWDVVKLNFTTSRNEVLPFKFLLEICLQIFDLDPFLLHCITVADCHRSVFFRLEIVSHAERCSDLVLTTVTFSDVSAVIILAVVILAQFCEDLLRTFVQFLGKRQHSDLDRCQRRMEMKHGTHIRLFFCSDIFLVVCAAQECQDHTVGSQ